MLRDITIPEVGEKIESGTVVAVLVSTGESVEVDQGIIEFETEKAVVEIPSPERGVIKEILVREGDEVKVGAVIARLDAEAAATSTEAFITAEARKKETAEEEPKPESGPKTPPSKEIPATERESVPSLQERRPVGIPAEPAASAALEVESGFVPASPTVRRLARELGADIESVPPSGPGGRITADDVKSYVKRIVAGGERVPALDALSGALDLPDFARWGPVERQPLPRIRRIIADGTSRSWITIPHVTQFDQADITELERFRQQHGVRIAEAGGKLTVTVLLMKVLVQALKEYAEFNASIDTQRGEIVYKKHYHIGIATDTDRGLLVPVVRDVDRKSLTQLAVELTDLAERTRHKKVSPDELDGGTFTISNQGSIGGTDFTPIVYWPQVAILGVSRAARHPVYLESSLVPRLILPLSLSYDHRIIDGADAARFLKRVAALLEAPLALYLDT